MEMKDIEGIKKSYNTKKSDIIKLISFAKQETIKDIIKYNKINKTWK